MSKQLIRPCWALLLLTGALVLAATGRSVAQPRRGGSENEVKVTGSASKPDAAGNQLIVLHIDVNKDWYIYANPVGNAKFEGNHTLVKVTGKVKPAAVKVEYPPGTPYSNGDYNYRIYEGKVAIRALVQRAPGDTGPLNIDVQVNACDKVKGICLLTGHVPLTVP